ncbi:LysR family transcriptional regulator [Jannaschia sp. CCS1]|uniref:LysR family transcriptional regulator n=1 Tax=Jannaschia sp. (strain CCS1) TaxID=290400 RepID=UPI000053B7AF|nr:LysR family transcriptional regulator [Jannaschia sp. CCS1]ABD56727.1 transcriptional regulator, LysR family [Jannaschia sp. CCS1]
MIKSRVTFKQLEAFVCVVDTGTFRKAAGILGTTQPNISTRIAALEDVLGTILMHRDAGSIRVTDKGAELLEAAREILRAGENFLEIAGRQDLIEDRLRLGVTELVACTWLHDFLRAFKDLYPAVRVELDVNLSTEIEKALITHQVDLALQTGPFARPVPGTLPLGDYPYCWVAAPSLTPPASFAALFDGPVISHGRDTRASRALAEHARAEGVAVNQIVHSSSLTSCVAMAVDAMGPALLPRLMVEDAIAQGRLSEFTCGWLPDQLQLFARFDPRRTPQFVRAAADLAVEIAG